MNKSTVSSIVASLVDEDLLLESPDRGGGVGRNPVNLSVKRDSNFAGAISFDAPQSLVAVVDIDGTIKARAEISSAQRTPEELVAASVARIRQLCEELGAHRFHGFGVTVGGIVDSVHLNVVYAANLEWKNVDLGSLLRAHALESESILVENDAKASALAELLLGNHRFSSNDILFVALGAGIGVGFAVHGHVLSGYSHAAGEVGHMTVSQERDVCSCGNTGCWEIYASERAPVAAYQKNSGILLASEAPINEVLTLALNGDRHAVKAVGEWARHVGIGIGNMIAMFDPEVVVIGGSITRVWNLIGTEVTSAALGTGKFARQRTTTILPSSLQHHPALLGAAALNIRRIFYDFSLAQ